MRLNNVTPSRSTRAYIIDSLCERIKGNLLIPFEFALIPPVILLAVIQIKLAASIVLTDLFRPA